MRQSAFLVWFELQHGKAPTTADRGELLKQYEYGLECRNMVYLLDEYNARKTSALYAWNAREFPRKARRGKR